VNIVRTVARKSSNRVKFCWLKLGSAVYVNQTNLNVKLSKKMGVQTGAGQKSGGNGPPRPPLRTATTSHSNLFLDLNLLLSASSRSGSLSDSVTPSGRHVEDEMPVILVETTAPLL